MDDRACFCMGVHAIITRLFRQTHGDAREDIYQEEEKQMKRNVNIYLPQSSLSLGAERSGKVVA
jgi:hypothetical protein